jgi:hypothetical protein
MEFLGSVLALHPGVGFGLNGIQRWIVPAIQEAVDQVAVFLERNCVE